MNIYGPAPETNPHLAWEQRWQEGLGLSKRVPADKLRRTLDLLVRMSDDLGIPAPQLRWVEKRAAVARDTEESPSPLWGWMRYSPDALAAFPPVAMPLNHHGRRVRHGIYIRVDLDDDVFLHTLAHELRHCYQWHRGWTTAENRTDAATLENDAERWERLACLMFRRAGCSVCGIPDENREELS